MLDAMLPYMVTQYGNPHSRTHAYGWESEEAVEKARKVRTHNNLGSVDGRRILPACCYGVASGIFDWSGST